MMEIYAACFLAKKLTGGGSGYKFEISSFAVAAKNKAEATGNALIYAKDTCKIEDGWYEHQVSLSHIPQDWMLEKLAE